MKVLVRIGVAVVLAVFVIIASGCFKNTGTGYYDDIGREIVITEIPERIVSHVPPITEILFALGLGDRIVGVSDYCDYPEEAKEKQSIGDYWNPSIESIVALEPDLVFTDGHSENILQLDSLEINYVVIDPKDFDGIYRDLELIGNLAGVEERASELIRDMKNSVNDVLELVKDTEDVRVFYVIDAADMNSPWTAGPGSFADTLINMSAGVNCAADAPSAWVQLSIEEVIRTDPEVILLVHHGTAFTPVSVFREHPAWSETTAVKYNQIYIIDGDLIDSFGPRLVQGLEEIARTIHPELYN